MGRRGRGTLRSPEELRAFLTLRLLPGLGDRTLMRMLEAQGSARTALSLSTKAFQRAAGAGPEKARGAPEVLRRVDAVLEACLRFEIRILTLGGPGYPPSLLALTDPPAVLFLRGPGELAGQRSVAIVGSRRASPVGRRTGERLGREFGRAGITVVSGLALGIDGAAHRGARAEAGSTIAVLGSGPDRAHPRGNLALFEEILENGLIVSEFPPGEPPRPYHFPRRNRIIAALSRAVVVVEAARRSGALITVDHALDLGLDVFAVPGSVEAPQSEGTNALLRDGAHLIVKAEDLLAVMGWDLPLAPETGAIPARPGLRGRTAEAPTPGTLLGALTGTPRSLDDLVGALGEAPGRLLARLTRLELEGSARRTEDGWIAVR